VSSLFYFTIDLARLIEELFSGGNIVAQEQLGQFSTEETQAAQRINSAIKGGRWLFSTVPR
jgi:hypothetical protein